MAKGTKYSQQFKEDAVQYRLDQPERPLRKAASEEAKEIARLQRELRDTKDALEVLKKAIGILGN